MNKIVALVACVFAAACTVEDGAAPNLTAPSEFALSVSMSATPDSLPRDGVSQSVVTVMVRDAAGRPVSGQRLTLSTSAGSLSESSVTTSSNGQASFTFTAPSSGTPGNAAIIQVVPVGTDGGNAASRNLAILFTGTSNSTRPTPSFTVTPAAPQMNQPVRFDASATQDEGAACLDACTYNWNFGDGTTASGRTATKTFSAARSYTVTLTVIDFAGSSASTAQSVVVATVAAPTVTLTVSPNPPLVDQAATFTATATPATGHSIASYAWTFGDGTSATTTSPTVQKTYTARGTYLATVTVTDGVGQTGRATSSFTITSTGVTASFTSSPTSPVTGQTVQFNGSNSTGTGGSTIDKWEWDFGNGSTAEGRTASVAYATVGTYVVRLTVTDSSGRTGTTTQNVTVTAP